MPAFIQQTIHDRGKEQVGGHTFIPAGKFMPIEFYSPRDQLLAAYVIAVAEEDFDTKVIQWTTRTSRANYPAITDAMSVSELGETSNEDVEELEYGGKTKTIVAPRLSPVEPISMLIVRHKIITPPEETLL